MTFQAAIRTNLPLCRKDIIHSFRNNDTHWSRCQGGSIAPNTWIDPYFLLNQVNLSREDVLAEDWEVKGLDKDWYEDER